MERNQMEQREIKIGGHYGLREHVRPGEPLQHVKVLERARRKWKVEWIDPKPGLTDYVRSNNRIVPWGGTNTLPSRRTPPPRAAIERTARLARQGPSPQR